LLPVTLSFDSRLSNVHSFNAGASLSLLSQLAKKNVLSENAICISMTEWNLVSEPVQCARRRIFIGGILRMKIAQVTAECIAIELLQTRLTKIENDADSLFLRWNYHINN
jgi:hypothetical protein